MELKNEDKLVENLKNESNINQKEETLLLEDFISHHCSEPNFNASLYSDIFNLLISNRIPFKETKNEK